MEWCNLMFPSSSKHAVYPYKSTEKKVTVSGNISWNVEVLMKNIIKDNCINPNYQNLIEETLRFDTDFRWVYHDNLVEDGVSQLVGFSHMFLLNGKSTSSYTGLFMPLIFEACHNTGISISKVIRGRCFTDTWDNLMNMILCM